MALRPIHKWLVPVVAGRVAGAGHPGALQERWPAPPAWLEAQEHDAAVARQIEAEATRRAEEAARRQEQEARPPEERIAGRLTVWVEGRRRKRQEPTPAEIEAKRAELLAELTLAADSDGSGGMAALVASEERAQAAARDAYQEAAERL